MSLKGLQRFLDTVKRLRPGRRGRTTMSDEDIAEDLRKWVEEGKYKEESSVETVALQLGLTPWMLTDYFRAVHGKRFSTWRKEIRLSRARTLLLERPDLPACKVGEMVGIKDKSNFKSQFRKATGLTPSQWREHHSGPDGA